MSFDPLTGGPCYLADIRRGAPQQIAQVLRDHQQWRKPEMSEHTPLLPCPFCGNEPRIKKRHDEDIWTHNIVEWTGVYCSECDIGFDWPPDDGEPTAIEQWNARTADPALPALVKALEEAETALSKITTWLGRLAVASEAGAQDNRFQILANAHAADAKNYRNTIKSISPALDGARTALASVRGDK